MGKNHLDPITSNGWTSAVIGVNVVDEIINEPTWTTRNFKEMSLIVDAECQIRINNGRVLTVMPNVGFFSSINDEAIYSLEFLTASVMYYIIAGF